MVWSIAFVSALAGFGISTGSASPEMGSTPSMPETGEGALVGCATRSLFFQDIYELALFDGPGATESIVMKVVHDGSLPGGLPKDWPPKLRQSISDDIIEEIDTAFALIRPGSDVEIVYNAPQDRSQLVIDGTTAVDVADATTYSAIRAMWFGDDPVSGKLKRRILDGQCRPEDRDGRG